MAILHIVLHFTVPALVAAATGLAGWWRRWLWLLAGLLIDVDHLLADPVYDPQRCSIGFHPLHTWPFLLPYALLCLIPRTRLLGIGLVLHLLLDAADCATMPGGSAQLQGFFGVPGWIQ